MDRLGLFAKYWQPGMVKRRLAASIGDYNASQVYYECLKIILSRLENVCTERVLAYTPASQHAEFVKLSAVGWTLQVQSDGNLGERMFDFFSSAWDEGGERVVLMGSDSPTLPVQYVHDAFAALQRAEVVLGPTSDGGYYLIGLSRSNRHLFEEIQWSTSRVWGQTIEILERLGCSYETLPKWYDVDNHSDLIRLSRELSSLNTREPVWADLRKVVEKNIQLSNGGNIQL